MDKREIDTQKITVYWWNFGTKTLDFKGTYKDYFKRRGIKVVPFIRRGFYGYRFSVCIGSEKIILEAPRNEYRGSCDNIIKMFLTVMGDKSKLLTQYNEYFINWR